MTKHEFHNALRLLLNIEDDQLSFLTPAQQDNFYSNPHMFFIRCDDATADKLWAVMYPKPKRPAAVGAKVVDMARWRDEVRVGGIPVRGGSAGAVPSRLIFAHEAGSA